MEEKTAVAGAEALNLFLYVLSSTYFPLRRAHPSLSPSPQLPVVAVSNSIVLPGTEANGVINYLLSAGLSSECDQYPLLSFRAARLCSPSPTPHSSGTAGPGQVWAAIWGLLSDGETGNEVAPQIWGAFLYWEKSKE